MLYYRAKFDFAVEKGILYFRGKRVLLKEYLTGIVKNQFNHVQAIALKYSLQKKHTGIIERRIQQLAKNKEYTSQYVRLSNKVLPLDKSCRPLVNEPGGDLSLVHGTNNSMVISLPSR